MKLEYFAKHYRDENYQGVLHSHACVEIIYCLAEGYTYIDEQPFPYKMHDLLIHADGSHHWESFGKNGFHYVIGINPKGVAAIKDGIIHDGEKLMLPLFEEINREITECSPLFKTIVDIDMQKLIALIQRNQLPKKSTKSNTEESIEKVKLLLDEQFYEPIDMDYISNTVYLSSEYIRKMFKNVYNISPIQYLIEKRIEAAKILLEQHDCTIKSIAKACGFQNEYYFCRIFKQVSGITPSEYRKTLST